MADADERGGLAELAGVAVSAWNDRRASGDTPAERGLSWRLVDRVAGWLYVRSEQ